MQTQAAGRGLVTARPPLRPSGCRRRHSGVSAAAAAGKGPQQAQQAATPTIATDAAVPEGHQGLHGFLYGEGGAEAHEAGSSYTFREGEDDGSALLPVGPWLVAREGDKPVGVYALHDSKRNLQFVGYARNMVLAVRGHLARVGEERCAFVRAMVFANRAMQSRAALQREADNWLEEAGTLPPGNGAEAELWEGGGKNSSVDASLMSADELAEYEDKKLKLRKAMGENLHDNVAGETESSRERRLKLIAAVEGDDWSEVIHQQTAEAAAAGRGQEQGEQEVAAATQQQPVTPFARASVHRAVGEAAAAEQQLEMTVEAVDHALDDVRPYLIADGGNVDVVAVEDGRVFLQLQGACGTCAASSATMKMGIERCLKAAFGEQLVEVLQVGGQEDNRATAESVDMHLNMLRGAVAAYGGSVEVVGVEQGVCTLHYKGPLPIGYGLRAAVRDKFPDIVEVMMVDPDTEEPIKFEAI
ncbi:nifU chloroplastic isoform A [Chlorella sorokiniana]|uniref:NifU chloroplastic isoform A n=1 Tax=Chlorella sorokiniana TaxID=3076 RepID=A0A2P6U522_CHLSO|nr:nifU chloroplastic isoform A [Chlorella sorokiniana]|eukprot:PRW61409.1 nifU chloroplastic isoform A [Chlorella sorokiniana]